VVTSVIFLNQNCTTSR